MAITQNPPDLPVPTVQILFRGLLVFEPERDRRLEVKVHHAAQYHAVRVAIETTPPAASGRPSELIYLPDSAGDNPIQFVVEGVDPRFAGIRKYPPAGSTANPEFHYDKLLRFRHLSPGHSTATEEPQVLSSSITLDNAYFFSAGNGTVRMPFQGAVCSTGYPIEVSFVMAANIYLTSTGRVLLKYVADGDKVKELPYAGGANYKIDLTNLPPEGMFGSHFHFRFYYIALAGVPQTQRHDACSMDMGDADHAHAPHALPLPIHPVTYLHPCLPVDGG